MGTWDPSDVFAAINDLSQALNRTPTIAEFLEERRRRNARGASIPTTTTIYKRFGSWADTVRAAGLTSGRPARDPMAACLSSLVACAEALGQDEFTTTAYDGWRAASDKHWSSSVTRKWYGPWPNALAALAAELDQRRAALQVSVGPRARLSPLAS